MVKQLILFFIIILSSCIFLPDKKLKMIRVHNNGTQLRLDGYYYYEFESDIPRLNPFFLYENGIIIYSGAFDNRDILKEEENIGTKNYYKAMHKSRTGFGVFEIIENNIKYEMWGSSNGGPLHTFINYGEILNDTTFKITSSYSHYNKKIKKKNLTYHFKKFSPKPDSTNKWIH